MDGPANLGRRQVGANKKEKKGELMGTGKKQWDEAWIFFFFFPSYNTVMEVSNF